VKKNNEVNREIIERVFFRDDVSNEAGDSLSHISVMFLNVVLGSCEIRTYDIMFDGLVEQSES